MGGKHARPSKVGHAEGGRAKKGTRVNQPLPAWVTITVVLVLLGLLSYNVVFVGPEGYPISIMLGGLLGAYAGLRELLNRKADDDK